MGSSRDVAVATNGLPPLIIALRDCTPKIGDPPGGLGNPRNVFKVGLGLFLPQFRISVGIVSLSVSLSRPPSVAVANVAFVEIESTLWERT